MPTYTYTCIPCDLSVDKLRSISEEEPIYMCDSCGGKLIRSYQGSPTIRFNGSGFYSTDKVK